MNILQESKAELLKIWPERVRTARRVMKLGQAEFAKFLGVTRQTVSDWETGKAVPSPERREFLEGL